MTSLLELRDKETVTTTEAIAICLPLVAKYQNVLANVIRIKTTTPEASGEGFGRRAADNTPLLLELQQILATLETELHAIERELERDEE